MDSLWSAALLARPIKPRSGEIFVARGEPGSPGYAIPKARKKRGVWQDRDQRSRFHRADTTNADSLALSALNAFFKYIPRVRRLTLGYKYDAATRLGTASQARQRSTALLLSPITNHLLSSTLCVFA
jgi:hypothetical protein